MTPYIFKWKSSLCACTAGFFEGKKIVRPCDEEHRPWCEIVGSKELDSKLLLIQRSKIPPSFRFTLARYGAPGNTFHRPSLVKYEATAPKADVGFFLWESLGVGLTASSEPERYADYLSNKASRGLTEKMWIEDWGTGASLLFPTELVADPSLCLPREEANRLFGITLDPKFVAIFKSIRRSRNKNT